MDTDIECEIPVQQLRKIPRPSVPGSQSGGRMERPDSGMARDRAFDACGRTSANSADLAGGVHIGHARAHVAVGYDACVSPCQVETAAEELGKFDIRDETIADGQIIALDATRSRR